MICVLFVEMEVNLLCARDALELFIQVVSPFSSPPLFTYIVFMYPNLSVMLFIIFLYLSSPLYFVWNYLVSKDSKPTFLVLAIL